MSLRTEIHDAFDELEPIPLGLDERVLTALVRDRRPNPKWSLRLRVPLSLVAVFVAVALVAVALMGGRLAADWSAFIAPHQQAAPLTPLQKLEARPVHLQRLQPNAHCPDGPYDTNGNIGTGPVHASGSAVVPHTSWGSYFHDVLFADGAVKGPLLVRARDLVTNQPIVFVGPYAAGPVAGTDILDGQVVLQHLELVIDSVAPPYAWQYEAGIQSPADCEGWQIDGSDFTETFVIAP